MARITRCASQRRPREELADAIDRAEHRAAGRAWDDAVWVIRSGLIARPPLRAAPASIEALQIDFPARVDWSWGSRLTTVSDDIAAALNERFSTLPGPPP